MKYCTYLTIYHGNRLPPFYIGYSTVSKVNRGYRGSVSSKKWKNVWKEELKNHPELFRTTILTFHETKEEATQREMDFQRKMNVLHNSLYVNQAISQHSDRTGWKRDEASKRAISKAMTGRKQSTEHVQNCSKARKERWARIPKKKLTEEQKQKLRGKPSHWRGKTFSEEHKAKLRGPRRPLTEDEKCQKSEHMKKVWERRKAAVNNG
jgi:hypothetical protein